MTCACLTSLFVLIASVSFAQPDHLGREFFIGFMKNSGGEPPSNEVDNDISLHITGETFTRGRVEAKALGIDIQFTVAPDSVTIIPLPNGNSGRSTIAVTTSDTVQPGMGVHITADAAIAVVGLNHKLYSTDAFSALPVDALGSSYMVMSYPASKPGQGAPMPGQFLLVAVHDNTTVTIVPTASTKGGRAAHTSFTVVLHRGEAYLVQSSVGSGEDPTGSKVLADKPLACFSGHERTEIPVGALTYLGNYPSRDHLVEQLPPLYAWGKTVIAVPSATVDKPDLLRILSADSNNAISIAGRVVDRLHAGEFIDRDIPAEPIVIEGSGRILVAQYLHTSWGEPDGASLPAYGDPAMDCCSRRSNMRRITEHPLYVQPRV